MRIQLIYMSAATRPIGSDELTELLIKARNRNESLGITGMLVYHEGAFLQILEGDERFVDPLYERITRDKRHTSCALLLRSYTDHRSFPEWGMGFVDTNHEELRSIPGFLDFFDSNFSRETFLSDPAVSRVILMMFRDGKWHQTVNTEHEVPAYA
jgi:hypothetical protein